MGRCGVWRGVVALLRTKYCHSCQLYVAVLQLLETPTGSPAEDTAVAADIEDAGRDVGRGNPSTVQDILQTLCSDVIANIEAVG